MATEPQTHAFDLSNEEVWREPSRDVLRATLGHLAFVMDDPARPLWLFSIANVTQGRDYKVAVYLGPEGKPFASCDCPAIVPCKHITEALLTLCWTDPYVFGREGRGYMQGFFAYFDDLQRIVDEATRSYYGN